MSSGGQTCPFCGKPFKRLQTHLPHCKMSPVSQGMMNTKTPPFQQEVMTNRKKQKISVSSPASQPPMSTVPETTTNRRVKSLQTFASTSTPESNQMSRTSPPSSSSLEPSKSSLTTTKSKKLKLVDQIKMAALSSSLSSSPSQPATVSKRNKKSLRALIEAARLSPVRAAGEGIKSTSLEPPSEFTATNKVVDPVTLRTPSPTGGNSCRPTVSNLDHITIFSTDHRSAGVLLKKSSRTEKAGPKQQTTKAASLSLDPFPGIPEREAVGGQSGVRSNGRINFWEDLALEGSREDLSGKDKSTGVPPGRDRFETLGSVKPFSPEQRHHSSLGSDTDPGRLSCKAAMLGQIQTTVPSTGIVPGMTPTREQGTITPSVLSHDGQRFKRLDAGAMEFTSSLVSAKGLLQNRKGSSKKTAKSKETSSIPTQDGGSPLAKPTSSLSPNGSLPSPPLSVPPSSLAAVSLSTMVNMKQITATARVDHSSVTDHTPGRATPHVPHPFPPATLPVATANPRPMLEPSWLESSIPPTTYQTFRGALAERSLGQVTLRELPDWLALKTPGSPREGFEILQRGWQWYYRRYIDVKRAGVGGVAMLLAGYCILSYVWSYPHIKRDRWRRYH